ncbi:patatin-like phospholipase family protein [Leptospira levettii]|uniref:patatin-like phospholipase family protein n=1 Tax=Leptospira levettii TaxID=2023178 RepID=UPI000C296748|nr:patatin-like phospholipase family protein [Leptospira levettii]PKA22723.1 esterase [Leptospira sp. mixed culture ATI2-C-A1]TGM23492.1 esterase [Leptospira levettii]
MKKILILPLLLFIISNCSKNEPALVSVTTHLTLREQPNKLSRPIKKLYNNQRVTILEETENFEFIDNVYGQYVKIKDADGDKGYVFDAYLVKEEFANKFKNKRICLVLSTGGSAGVSHIGALRAINYLNITPDCVYGNSTGALIGSLYARYPNQDYQFLYSNLMSSYFQFIKNKKSERAEENGIIGGLALAFLNPFLGIAGGMLIAESSAANVSEKDISNFQYFLNEYYNGARIQNLEIDFATSHFKKKGQGVEFQIEKSGNLANAVINSISNPYIFKLKSDEIIDPGIDRSAATPILDACSVFNPDIIIAINVTGNDALYDPTIKCKVVEVKLSYRIENENYVLLGMGDEYDSIIKKSFSDSLYIIKKESKKL